MKEIILALFIYVSAIQLHAQNNFGIRQYSHPQTECTSGSLGVGNPGFLIAGGSGAIATNNINFSIERTNLNGVFNSAAFEFQKEYMLFGSVSCSSTTPYPQILFCKNVKTISMPNGDYVVVGTTDFGVFFANLAANGTVNSQGIYIAASPGPVHVTASVTNATEFYITFTINGAMHIYHMDQVSGQIAGIIIDALSSGLQFIANGIVHSPFPGNNLVIVGKSDGSANGTSAFFYEIDDALTSTTNNMTLYYFSSLTPYSWFESIAVVNNAGPIGFLVGGKAESPNASVLGTSWVIMFGAGGGAFPMFSTIIEGSLDVFNGSIKAVTGRYSSFYSAGELYAAAVTSVGIVVYKLDANGVPMSSVSSVPDEFLVLAGAGATPAGISYINPGTVGYDEGLHVYGTIPTTPGDHHLSQLYFSGETGCNNPTFVTQFDQTPASTLAVTTNTSGGLTFCSNFLITESNVSNTVPTCGPFSSVGGGDNNRSSLTSINKMKASKFNIYPNPSSGIVFIEADRIDEIVVHDVLGKTVVIDFTNDNFGKKLNFSTVGSGLYFVHFRQGNTTKTQKLIITN